MAVADENVQYVSIHDLPPEVPDGNLWLVLGRKRESEARQPGEIPC